MISAEDKKQIEKKGISLETIEYQLDRFKNGFPSAEVIKPATREEGIIYCSDEEKQSYASFFDAQQKGLSICRMVPASGAATRMFKHLFGLKDKLKGLSIEGQLNYLDSDPEGKQLIESIDQYPFRDSISEEAMASPSGIINYILDKEGLSYGTQPKGLLLFHRHGDAPVTAYEEHLHEAVAICSEAKELNLHFTVSEEHEAGFRELEAKVLPKIQEKYKVKFNISYSFQKAETDTIAVKPDNTPLRDDEGRLLFRPGGHGALLQNLNDLAYEIVFLNNIDNVSPEGNRANRSLNKKFLAGLLLKTRERVFTTLAAIEKGEDMDVEGVLNWMEGELYIEVPADVRGGLTERQLKWILAKLNRPLRVCGMVKNEGEPGGGPYFMRDSKGNVSLQVVELSQVDMNDDKKAAIANSLTHFNPVDLVCCIRDYKGDDFDLSEFVDGDTGFISEKSVQGKELKALELPGLWNGSMSDWLTIFAEVPGSTFTPVKTVFDLVREAHI